MTPYADWKAPKQDEQHLIWPDPAQVLVDTANNHALLSSQSHVRVQNTPLAELRRATRSLIGAGDEPILATGHQIEMYHPGVWVKNLLIDFAAAKLNGRSLHLAVDTDSPKHLKLRWPGGGVQMSDDPAIVHGEWSGLVKAPSPSHRQRIVTQFKSASRDWSYEPLIEPFLDVVQSGTGDDLTDLILQGAAAVDRSLGLSRQHVRLTQLTGSDGWLALVHHITADIERYAHHYNTALADYRAEQKIDSTTRPMPDLLVTPQRIELPFWLDDLKNGSRARAMAVREHGAWTLAGYRFSSSPDAVDAAAALRAHLKERRLRVSPRALTLTSFLRLLLVDQFAHGIGGARYDQVTDRILRSYFKVDPPAFSVTTATLFFPGAGERSDDCIPCLLTEGHRLRHNLHPAKDKLLAGVHAEPAGSVRRHLAFLAMHRAIDRAARATDALDQWRQRLARARARADRDRVSFDRELFFGLQSRKRLTAMIERYRIAFA